MSQSTSIANIVNLSAPAAGTLQEVQVEPGTSIRFAFDTGTTTFGREGNALILTLQDGGTIRLVDYFAAGNAASVEGSDASLGLPSFILSDGAVITGHDFLKSMAGDMDITPAAGPAASTASANSGGSGEYSDDAGSLIGGIDRLGDTTSYFWERSTNAPEALRQYGTLQADASGALPSLPSTELPPSVVAGPYLRAVLYTPGNSADMVSTPIFFDHGSGPAAVNDICYNGSAPFAQYEVTVSVPEGWSDSWVTVNFNVSTGRLEFRLTADGITEMQRLGLSGEDLQDFLKVSVTDRNSGADYEYTVEVVATDDPNFNSAAHDATHGTDDNLANIGEFHEGKGSTGAYTIHASDRNDEIIINDTLVSGSTIHASGSAALALTGNDSNTIKLNEGVLSDQAGKTTHITTASGTVDISKGVSALEDDAKNVMYAGGSGSINVHGNTALSADKGENSLTAQNVTINGTGMAVSATNGGSNEIDGKTVGITGTTTGAHAYGGKNTVSSEDGTITIQANNGLVAGDGGQNVFTGTGTADITVNAKRQGLYAKDGSNTITTEDGTISVATTTTGSAIVADAQGINRIEGANAIITSVVDGISSANGGKNHVTADDAVSVTAARHGVFAEGAGSEIHISGKTVDATGYHSAIRANGVGALVEVSGETVNLTSTNGRTIDNWSAGTINVTSEKDMNIRLVDASETSAGAMTLNGTTTLKSGADINITVDKGTYQTAGVESRFFGTTNLEAEDNVNIKVHAEKRGTALNYGAVGVNTSDASTTNIVVNKGDITLDVDASDGTAYGVYATGSGGRSSANNLTAKEGTLSITAAATDAAYQAAGITSTGVSTTNIDVKNLDVNVTVGDMASNYQDRFSAAGVISLYNGQGGGVTNIDVAEAAKINVAGAGNASGISARGRNATNTIDADSLELNVSGGTIAGSRVTGLESTYMDSANKDSNTNATNTVNVTGDATITVEGKGLAAGMYMGCAGGNNTLTAGGDVVMNVTSLEGDAHGIYRTGSINADSVTMTIKGDLSAIVMNGMGTVTANNVIFNAESDNGMSYGMHAFSSGYNNLVRSEAGHALDLEINADYAMYSTYSGRNTIQGNSVSGGEGDSIRLNGDILGSGGANSIRTGAGDDIITINGTLSGSGALYLDGGDGNDTLVLVAADSQEFLARYGDWLNGLNGVSLRGIENIEFAGIQDLSELSPVLDAFLNYATNNGIDVTINDAGIDSLSFGALLDTGISDLDMAALSSDMTDDLNANPMFANSGNAENTLSASQDMADGASFYDAQADDPGMDALIQQQIMATFNN